MDGTRILEMLHRRLGAASLWRAAEPRWLTPDRVGTERAAYEL